MLLGAEPLQRQRDFAPVPAQQPAFLPLLGEPLVEQREREQPP